MKVVIPLALWLRGNDDGYFLKNGKYCALGFILKAQGVSDKMLEGKGSVIELAPALIKKVLPPEFYIEDKGIFTIYASERVANITDANDNPMISDDERIERLKLFCEPYGFDLEFVPCT